MHSTFDNHSFFDIMKILLLSSLWMRIDASPTITADEYNAVGEGLSSIQGDDMWGTMDYAGTNTVNLSHNAFTNTSLAALDFRETSPSVPVYDPPTINGPAYEPLIHHLDLSHNLITDASLDFFLLEITDVVHGVGVVRWWYLRTLDLSYNKITNMSNFPTKKFRGDLNFLNLEHNLIIQIGNLEPDAFHQMTIDPSNKPPVEVNLEHNLLNDMPLLGFTVPDGPTDSIIIVKNNKISVVDLSSCTAICGYWMLKVVNIENNELTEFTKEMIDWNWDTEIFNFNNNKITEINSFNPSDGFAYYSVKELYFNNNEIVTIDSAAFDHFTDLQILELSNNKIVAFPFDHIFNHNDKFPVLNSLLLDNNKLTSVSDEASRFPRGFQMTMDLTGKT